jgi:hypothetical protein
MRATMTAAVSAHPDLTGLPGSNVLQQLVNGAEAWALVIALLPHYAARGRMAALVSGASALIVGAAPGLVNFFAHLGATAK